MPKLRVPPSQKSFRHRGADVDLQIAARDLHVQAILNGKITVRGDSLVVRMALVDVEKDAQLWGQQFTRKMSDILVLEEEIADEVLQTLKLKLAREAKKKRPRRHSENQEAYRLYLKGRFYWAKRSPDNVKRAIELYQQALDIDPNYAQAYAGIADCYMLLGFTPYATMPPGEAFPRAKSAAQKALALDESLAEAYGALSQCAFFYDWDWGAAERALRRSIELQGPNATLIQSHALTLLAVLGRVDEAVAEARRLAEADPLSVNAAANLALILYLARKHDDAAREARKAIEINPMYRPAHVYLSYACQGLGRFDEGVAAAEQCASLTDQPFQKYGNTGWIYGLAGRRQDALRMLDQLTEVAAHSYVSPNCFAWIYGGLGDGDNWQRTMRACLEERSGVLVYLKSAAWDPMRSHPYFDELVRRIGLP